MNDGDHMVMMMTLNPSCFVLQKVKEHLVGGSLVSKLQAKHDHLKVAVEKGITSAFHTQRYPKVNR